MLSSTPWGIIEQLLTFLLHHSAEVRNEIYNLLLVSPDETTLEVRKGVAGWRAKDESKAFEFHLAIIRTSKVIREEAQTVFLKHNRFVLGGTFGSLYGFLNRLTPANRRTITSLCLNYAFHQAEKKACFGSTRDIYPWADQEARANMAFRLLARCDNLRELGVVVTNTGFGPQARMIPRHLEYFSVVTKSSYGFSWVIGMRTLQNALKTFDTDKLELSVYAPALHNCPEFDNILPQFEKMLKGSIGEQ
jgi:hypothetical protein